jgi:hypothetical protein
MDVWRLQARGPGWEVRDAEDRLIGRLSEIEPRHARLIAGSYELLVTCRDLFRARLDAGYITGDEEDALDAINALL